MKWCVVLAMTLVACGRNDRSPYPFAGEWTFVEYCEPDPGETCYPNPVPANVCAGHVLFTEIAIDRTGTQAIIDGINRPWSMPIRDSIRQPHHAIVTFAPGCELKFRRI